MFISSLQFVVLDNKMMKPLRHQSLCRRSLGSDLRKQVFNWGQTPETACFLYNNFKQSLYQKYFVLVQFSARYQVWFISIKFESVSFVHEAKRLQHISTSALTNKENMENNEKSSLGCESMCFLRRPVQQVERNTVEESCGFSSEWGLSHWQRNTSVIDCSYYQTSNGLFLKSTWDKQAPEGPWRAAAFVFQGCGSADGAPGCSQHLSADGLAPLNNSLL